MKKGLTTYHLHLKIERLTEKIEKHEGCNDKLIELRKERYIARKELQRQLLKKDIHKYYGIE